MSASDIQPAPDGTPTLAEMTRVFARIGILSFGGPAAQIALMHRELVDERPWLSEEQFLGALSFCTLLPGPEAMQLATYAGWRVHGVVGGLIGGLLFVLPGAAVMACLALAYAYFGQVPLVEALFLGIKATVVVIVLQALQKVATRALKSTDRWIIAGLSFLGIFVLNLPFPLIILCAAAYGFATARAGDQPPPEVAGARPLRTAAIWTAIWLAPLSLLALSGADLLTEIALFFAQLAVVTFGGAYAVLAYMTQQVVQDYGWITTAQMMDGLGLAETTPGPLILVTQFVGMLAGFGSDGAGLALLAGIVTLWMTFVPSFLFIFVGAPFIEWIASRPRLAAALSATTAAVVGVILNLTVWFALHVFFAEVGTLRAGPIGMPWPIFSSFTPVAALLCAIATTLLLWRGWPLPGTLAVMAALGAATAMF
ncbi:MAG: chromate efflux transporter [Rhodobacteraceae bacterium]|nr:chromate efflux transporter [Paracoccaceae bacterium]